MLSKPSTLFSTIRLPPQMAHNKLLCATLSGMCIYISTVMKSHNPIQFKVAQSVWLIYKGLSSCQDCTF